MDTAARRREILGLALPATVALAADPLLGLERCPGGDSPPLPAGSGGLPGPGVVDLALAKRASCIPLCAAGALTLTHARARAHLWSSFL